MTAPDQLVMSINNSIEGVKMRFIREKNYPCRDGYMEVDQYYMNDINAHKFYRAKRKKSVRPSKNLNIENSRCLMRLVFNNNSKTGDYYITLTYSKEFLSINDK